MNSIIFCEGRTDAVLIGQYLSSAKGWKFNGKGKKGLNLEKEDNFQLINTYNLGEDWIYIWGVGGKTRFENPIKKILLLNAIADKPFSFDNIVVITDRDDGEKAEDIYNEFREYLNGVHISDNDWNNYPYKNGFGEDATARILLLIIPFDEKGALETVMIHALSEEDSDSIVPQCCTFVDNLKTQNFLKKSRDKLKAKLSTVVSIINPDRAVDSLVEIVYSVDWCKSKYVNETFKKLLEI